MDLIEQAVFTSARTDQSAGYQLVATSPGVDKADARELAVWGPSHDALLESAPGAVSYNFHRLPSGAYCVSRTSGAGREYSGRGGFRVYTQCLLVPPLVLRRFANNPFALLRAATASGALRLYDEVPKHLEPLRLLGRATAVDSALLAQLSAGLGSYWLASLVQAALTAPRLAVTGGPAAEKVIAGVINCLPPECRTEFSFSTGLKVSSRRPFRVVALSDDREERRRAGRLYNVAVLDLSRTPPGEFAPMDSWPNFIHRALKSGRTALLVAQLSRRRADFTPEDLSLLGLQLLEELDASSLRSDSPELPVLGDNPAAGARDDSPAPISAAHPAAEASAGSANVQQAHAAHRRFAKSSSSTAVAPNGPAAPSERLQSHNPRVQEMLGRLDEAVYEAVVGDSAALDKLEALWPKLCSELGDELLAESRLRYLQYALSIWQECVKPEGISDPTRSVRALDVLCTLFDEV